MEKRMLIKEEYLYLPVQKEKQERLIEIYREGDNQQIKIMEFMVPVGAADGEEYDCDFYARIPVSSYRGQTLIFKGKVPQAFWKKAEQTLPNTLKALKRPAIHFTADTGWINDPNGLVYADGIYHLYFQYNPLNTTWNNLSWGHAVSRDLLHWEQMDTVLFPDQNGMMYSGCGIKNEKGLLGLPKEALIFFYTAAGGANPWSKGQKFTQRIAYSLDGGRTLKKLPKPYLDSICQEDRDPKVFWHEASNAYIMTLWLQENEFAILRSADLESFQITDRFSLDEAWECPDLLEIKAEDGSRHWVFWSADGFYYWGEFDGYRFQTDGKQHLAYINKLPYAAQIYSGVTDRVISIPWLRITNRGRLFTGAMGIPRELTVREEAGEKYLAQLPVRELDQQKQQIWQKQNSLAGCFHYESIENKAILLEMVLEANRGEPFHWQINGSQISYNPDMGDLLIDTKAYPIGSHLREILFVIDDTVFEVTARHGIITGIFELKEAGLKIFTETDPFEQFVVYEIKHE